MSERTEQTAEPLHFGYTRREFFHLGQPEHPPAPGRPVLRLSALATLTDRELGALVPRLVDGCQVWADGEGVWVRLSSNAAPERVRPADLGGSALVASLDERINLARLAERAAETANLPYEEVFALVKASFLALVSARVMVPA